MDAPPSSDTAKRGPLCPTCGQLGYRGDGLDHERFCAQCHRWFAYCEKCDKAYTAPMSPFCRDNHEAPLEYHPFIPYFDFALGKQIDSLAQRHREMRSAHLDYRDKPSKGQLAERADRAQQRRQEQQRGHAAGGDNRPSGKVFSR